MYKGRLFPYLPQLLSPKMRRNGKKLLPKILQVRSFYYFCTTMISPVALFVYNRLDNMVRTLDALLANTLAPETHLFVFSDGGRDARSWKQVQNVRDYLHRFQIEEVEGKHRLASITIVERSQNIYLERNIMEGISQVFEQHETVVVLEDDIQTGPFFLQYMNDAFTLYRDEPRVMHVSGFTNLSLPLSPQAFYFTPHMSGWGWGTWRDRWQTHFRHFSSREEALKGFSTEDENRMEYGGVFPCLRSLNKKPIPWDICWEMAIYRSRGLCLTPRQTLVRNTGLSSGTHFRSFRIIQHFEYDRPPLQERLSLCLTKPESDPRCEELFAEAIRDWGIRYTLLGKILRSIKKKLL